jgi:hypothetical protein
VSNSNGVRPNLNTREAQNLEEFITNYKDVFVTNTDDNRRIQLTFASSPTTLVRSVSPVALPLHKQSEMNGILKDMGGRE